MKNKNIFTGVIIAAVVVVVGGLAFYFNATNLQGSLPNITKSLKPLTSEPAPATPITRAEFAGLAALYSLKLPLMNSDGTLKKNCFPDTVGIQYENAICALAEKGYMTGYPDGTFRPNNTVIRAEAAKILVSVYYPQRPLQAAYKQYYLDVTQGDWFYESVKKLADMKMVDILPGPKSYYHPGDLLSKTSAQVMIQNAINAGLAG